MEVTEVIYFTSQTLILVMMLSMPPILAAAIVGTLVSLLPVSYTHLTLPTSDLV